MNSQSAMQNNGAKVAVIVDSRYGSTLALARAIKEGVAGTTAEVRLRRVPLAPPEYSIDEDRKSYRETRKDLAGLNEATVDDMRWATGIIFGSPTRYGLMSTPMRAFIDSIACLWREGALIGKVGAAFTSSGGMHSGNEMTLLTTLLPLLQHGMVIVGVPHSVPALVRTRSGGSPYGATAVTGFDGDRPMDQDTLDIAYALGARVGRLAAQVIPEPAPVVFAEPERR